jgi:hypothetical protein
MAGGIREEDMVGEEEQEGRPTLLMVLFDNPQDAASPRRSFSTSCTVWS